MKRFRIIKIIVLCSMIIFFSGCFLLNKYIYTDRELDAYYQNIKLKPVYKDTKFLSRNMHYAIISRSDTLPLLVLIHGAPGAWYGYMNLMNDTMLQKKFKIVSVDRLGYGKSGYGNAELSVQMQALAIKKVIDVENRSGKKVYLFGRSYGAPIAAWLAINYPQATQKLFMVSPVIDPEKEKFYWFSNIGKWRIVQWTLPSLLNVATEEKFYHSTAMKAMEPKWKRLYVPSYILVGENDQIADTANFTFAKRHIVNAPAVFIMVKNSGHLVTHDQPQLVEKLLLED